MKAEFYHARSFPFYKSLLGYLDYRTVHERLNHGAFRVEQRRDVDRVRDEFMRPRGPASLYRTPREFPEHRPGYYAVFFEDPDRLKLEVVHLPAGRG